MGLQRVLKDRKAYTVGWICALPKELTAATAMLDERHADLPKIGGDTNVYTLGSIGNHNIVIACLPKGRYGTVSAATVVANLANAFPSIKFGLMVGIGGGVPPKVRLGDVVISTPVGQFPGVVQWDLGKKTEGGKFERTGFLNSPPSFLLAALARLETEHELAGSQIDHLLIQMGEKYPKLAHKYLKSELWKDDLFKPDYVHVDDSGGGDDEENEESCHFCDKSQIIRRKPREMRIHHGLIASGDSVIKDASQRDKLNQDLGGAVLCFEMEAAGLMNHVPHLVIRGICDYADSHKNKIWQEHAAAVAAAFSKELMGYLQPEEFEGERSVKDILAEVGQKVEETHTIVQDTSDNIKRFMADWRQTEIDRWLAPPSSSTNYNEALRKRHAGTGSWFLNSDVFNQWKTRRNSFLWLYGIPGCGKTILCSSIIENLWSYQPLLYFYFDFTKANTQTFEKMARSLISQLYGQCEETSPLIKALFASCRDGREQPTYQQLRDIFSRMMQRVTEAWIVLDALDEASESERKEVLLWMEKLLAGSEEWTVHIILTSRPEQDIESRITGFADMMVHIESEYISHDISAYVHWRVREDDGLKRWRIYPEVQNEIESTVGGKANGMFRWAACQLDTLEICLDYRNLCEALASLPETLYETYTRILRRIPKSYRQNAIKILQLLTYSKKPLKIEEVVDAIAVNTEGGPYFDPKYRMPDQNEILRYCSSLVVAVSHEEDPQEWDDPFTWGPSVALQLAHLSVKEYLLSDRLDNDLVRSFQEVEAEASIARTCLGYLMGLNPEISTETLMRGFPFVDYSVKNWLSFARPAENSDEKLQGLIKEFFNNQRGIYKNCYSLYRPEQPDNNGWAADEVVTALYYASSGGLFNAVADLVSQGADINAHGGDYGNAFQVACFVGHVDIVELLLSKGAEVNAQGGGFGGTAIQAAAAGGHTNIVEILLKHGADINQSGGQFGNALEAAIAYQHYDVAEFLISMGANFDGHGRAYQSALGRTCVQGRVKIFGLLLRIMDKNLSAEERNRCMTDSMGTASSQGYTDIVRLLLAYGADVNGRGEVGATSFLEIAARNGHIDIAELLLQNSADVNYSFSYNLGNALISASERGHADIVQLLLRNGAIINPPGELKGRALAVASKEGNYAIVEMLLRHGADVNARDGSCGEALYVAAEKGDLNICELLLRNGANVNAVGGLFGNALQTAYRTGHRDVVELLLSWGARDPLNETPQSPNDTEMLIL